MAKIKLTKTLIIGLGGTGNMALKFAKKRYYELYATDKEREEGSNNFTMPLIEYLAIDTSNTDLDEKVGSKEQFKLRDAEQFYAKVDDVVDLLEQEPFIKNEWMFKSNTKNPEALTDGAHQVRQYGRLGFMFNYGSLKQKIKEKVDLLNAVDNIQNDRYESLGNSKINVIFCFSVAGGTGSGTFLDVAYLTKEVIGNKNMTSQAYLVLPEIFDKIIRSGVAKTNIYSNTYAALRELDYCMENKVDKDMQLSQNIKIKYKGAPFKIVHLITNKNTENVSYKSIEHIMELIGNNIVLKTGSLNVKTLNAWDNISGFLTQYKYLDKKKTQYPRYLALGYAELKYDVNEYCSYLTKKKSQYLLNKIINSNSSVSEEELDHKMINWEIKEHESDLLIDSILPKNISNKWITDGDGYNGENTVTELKLSGDNWLTINNTNIENLAKEKLSDLKNNKITTILNYIKIEVLNNCGIENTISLIDLIIKEGKFISLYNQQMKSEISNKFDDQGKGLDTLIDEVNTNLNNSYELLSEAQSGGFFSRNKHKCLNIIPDVEKCYNFLYKYNYEKIRRTKASEFYSQLLTDIGALKNDLQSMLKKVQLLEKNYENDVNLIVKATKSVGNQPFLTNLHEKEYINLPKQMTDLGGFMKNNNLFDILSYDSDILRDNISSYIGESDYLMNIKNNKNITTYIESLSNDNRDELFEELDDLSNPLLKYNYGSFKMGIQLQDGSDGLQTSELWGVYNKELKVYSKIEEGSITRQVMSTDNNHTLSVSKVHYPIPMCGLHNIDTYYSQYVDRKDSLFDCGLDKRITKAMDDDKFDIIQKVETDSNNLFAFIFGCVLYTQSDNKKGLYRSGNGSYKLYSERGNSIDDKVISLNKSRRDEAFEVFCDSNHKEQMLTDIKSYFNSLSSTDQQELIDNVKDKDAYIKTYSQIGRNLSDLKIAAKDNVKDLNLLNMLSAELDLLRELTIDSIRDYI